LEDPPEGCPTASGAYEMSTESDRMRALESRLDGTLRPIAPPGELLLRLRRRIRMPERGVIVSRLRDWQRLWLVLGGAISGGLVVLTVARAIFHLVGRRQVG
jgi:hypothetical protein